MKAKNNVLVLLENGFHFDFISRLKSSEISILAEKVSKKIDTKEAVDTVTKIRTFSPGEVSTMKTKGESFPGGRAVKLNPDGSVSVTMEGEVTEKFESKAQQGLFWARCNKCSSKNCKWCKMAKEFSDSTTKKEYKDMPEKKHPEKTVKYKKKETTEEIESYLEDRIFEMIETHINPSMTKGELINTILEKISKNENMILRHPKKMSMFSKDEGMEMKTPIGKMFSMSGEMKENTKEKERTREKDRTKEKERQKGNPFKDPNPDVQEKPKASTKEKERTREKDAPTKPGTPPKRRGNPFKDPNPDVQEKPKAGQQTEKQKSDFMQVITMALK